jgi:hypothetical protein
MGTRMRMRGKMGETEEGFRGCPRFTWPSGTQAISLCYIARPPDCAGRLCGGHSLS